MAFHGEPVAGDPRRYFRSVSANSYLEVPASRLSLLLSILVHNVCMCVCARASFPHYHYLIYKVSMVRKSRYKLETRSVCDSYSASLRILRSPSDSVIPESHTIASTLNDNTFIGLNGPRTEIPNNIGDRCLSEHGDRCRDYIGI